MTQSPLDQFDPNNAPHPWATYCPGRYSGGSFKTHAHRQHALAALNDHIIGILFEFKDGKWREVVRREHTEHLKRDRCEMCNQSLLVPRRTYDYRQRRYVENPNDLVIQAFQVLERRGGRRGKLTDPLKMLVLCDGCKQGLGY